MGKKTTPEPAATEPPLTDVVSGEPTNAGAAADQEEAGLIARLAVSGSVWTLGGFGIAQVLRLGGNLLLTRMLFPEAFGLIALVNVFIQGLQLFSDFGVRGSVIHHQRGDEPAFLNTAWSIQIIRGVALWIILSLLASPISRFYGQPQLAWLLSVVSLVMLLDGFTSTAIFSLHRHVQLRKLAILEVSTQSAGVAVMITWAWVSPSVWALVAGGLTRSALMTIVSHFLLPNYSNRWGWDRDAARALLDYGRWIFIATALTFLVSHSDRALLGKFLTVSELGVYSIAATLALCIIDGFQATLGRVFLPIYAKIARHDRTALRRYTLRIRAAMMACFLPVAASLVIWGQAIIDFLYDDRYADAGWMLRILAAGAMSVVIVDSAQVVVLAHGDSYRHMWVQLTKAALFLGLGAAGGITAGVPGFLVGVAASRALAYPAVALAIRRYGTWLPALDGTAFAACGLLIATAVWLS